jgi:hypothetical protein
MGTITDALDRVVLGMAARMHGGVALAVAIVLYGGGGLALPLASGWPALYLVGANLGFTLLALCTLLAWSVTRIEAGTRRRLLNWTTNLRVLTAEEFEWLVGEVYRREGWSVVETGRQDAADGNVDLDMRRDRTRLIVQCKRWTSRRVGVDEVRKFAGTLLRERLPGSSGAIVTLAGFTQAAESEAERTGITLVGDVELHARIERVRRAEPCPACARPMRLAHSLYGWWFRCGRPGCRGKRDLGVQPGPVAEFLTTPR